MTDGEGEDEERKKPLFVQHTCETCVRQHAVTLLVLLLFSGKPGSTHPTHTQPTVTQWKQKHRVHRVSLNMANLDQTGRSQVPRTSDAQESDECQQVFHITQQRRNKTSHSET